MKKELKLKTIWHDKVWSKVIAGLIVAAVIGFLGYAGNHIRNWRDHNPHDTTEVSNSSVRHADSTPVLPYSNESGLISSGKLPYLDDLPILDQTLFVRYNYNDLVFGGKNLHNVAIAARSKMGSDLPLGNSSFPDELQCDITKEPHIEFRYRDMVYGLTITGRHDWGVQKDNQLI